MTFVYVINKSSCTSSHYCHWWTAIMSFGRAKCVWEGASGDGLHNDNCSNCLPHDQMGDDLLSMKWNSGRWQNKEALLSFPHLPFICMYAEERAAKALCWAGWHDHSCTLVWTPPRLDCSRSPTPAPTQAISQAAFHDATELKNTKSNDVCDRLTVPLRSSWNVRWRTTESTPVIRPSLASLSHWDWTDAQRRKQSAGW